MVWLMLFCIMIRMKCDITISYTKVKDEMRYLFELEVNHK